MPKIEETLAQVSNKPEEAVPDPAIKKKKKVNTRKNVNKLRDIVFKLIPCLFPAVIDNILVGSKINPDESI